MRFLPVNKILITLLMDNITDRLLPNSQHAHRPTLGKDEKFLPAPIAEHGFSAKVETEVNNNNFQSASIQRNMHLFDAGMSENGIIFDSDLFGINLQNIHTIVLSHGHFDHFLGLQSVAKRISRPIKLYAHPDPFLKRWDIFPHGTRLINPILDQAALKQYGIIVQKMKDQVAFLNKRMRIPLLLLAVKFQEKQATRRVSRPNMQRCRKRGLFMTL